MQGCVIHARKNDKELGPHLTQQSAQADHWALQENRAHEGVYCPKVVFYIFPLKQIFAILRKITIQLLLIIITCKGKILFFSLGYLKTSGEVPIIKVQYSAQF